MLKLLGTLIVRPVKAFEDLPVKKVIWLTVILALIAIIFVNYSQRAFVRPDIFYNDLAMKTEQEYVSSSVALRPGIGKGPEFTPDIGSQVQVGGIILGILQDTVVFIAGWMLMAWVFFLLLTRRLGGKGTFGLSAAVVGLGWFPLFLHSLLQGIYTWATGLQVFWSSAAAGAVFTRLDLFVIWNTLLVGIGLGTAFGVRLKSTIILAAAYRVLIILLALSVSLIRF